MITSTFSAYFDVYMYSFRMSETKVTQMAKYAGTCAQHVRNKEKATAVWTWVLVIITDWFVVIVVESHFFSVWNFHIIQVTPFFWHSKCYGDFHVILIYLKWASPLPILLVRSNHSTIVRNFHLNLQLYSYIYCNFILISNFPVQTRIHKRSHKQKQPSHENKLKHFITFHYVSELPSWMFSV